MLPIKSLTLRTQLTKAFMNSMLFGIGLYSGISAYALEVNVATFLTNLAQTSPNLMQLTTAIAYVMGMWLIIKSIIGLKNYGDSRSSGGQGQGLKGPLITMAVGGALFYLPSSVQVGLSTFWANPTPYAYYNENNDTWSELINSVFMIIQLVGTIAFIRGLIDHEPHG